MTIQEQSPWGVIASAQIAASNIPLNSPVSVIAIHLCNAKGVDPYAWASNAMANWQFEIYTALLQQAIVELELGED